MMSEVELGAGTVFLKKRPVGVPASQVRGILRTFQKALASEGLTETVTISQEARGRSAEITLEKQER
jgi:hypothetical protein